MSLTPITPIACAGAICLKGDHVLLIRRGQPPRAGEWSVPGGRMERDETPEACAMRELTEETGVTATLHSHLVTLHPTFEGKGYTLHDYLCLWSSGDPVAADDVTDARWFTLAQAGRLGMWPATLAVVESAFQRRRKALSPPA